MEIIRVTRPSENKNPSKLKSRIPLGRAAVALGFALPAAVLLPGCVPVEMIPTPDFWAQQTEHEPIRVASEDLNTIPQSTRQAIETKSKSSITEALIFDVSQGNPDGYVIDKTQNNASGISFDLYTLSNGKMVGAFPSEDGTVNMTEVIGVDEITSDGYVYRTLKTTVNNNGQDEEHVFIALGYGQVKTANDISSLDGTKQQALVQSQIEKNQIESIIFGNPYLPSPNAIVLIEDKNFQGQKDVTFTDSLKNIGYQVKFVSSQQDILSTNTPKSSTRTPLIPTNIPTETATVTPTPTSTLTETPTATPIALNVPPEVKTVLDSQKAPYVIDANGNMVIDNYDTQTVENTAINPETIKVNPTTDGLNPNIVTAKDAQGNLYALNPDFGWFKVPQEIQMDYNKYKEYTDLPYRYFADGTANIISALKYAENPTISPDAITPRYWANYSWFKNVLYAGLFPSADSGAAQKLWPEQYANIYYTSETKPFAWNGFFTTHLPTGEKIYLDARTLKNPTKTNPEQTINLFYGWDPTNYEIAATQKTGGLTSLQTLFGGANRGVGDFAIILSPPETLPDGTPFGYQLPPGNPIVGSLQKRGELISLFSEEDQKMIWQAFLSGLERRKTEKRNLDPLVPYVSPLTSLPEDLAKYILHTTIK